ncbi:S1/P1 nuclease [Mucilaginibacter gynuensis]|uniref:S1/P1 nuclease n=1 Tax=Mucilaginibacter gynuensis TaxID=1302236 RepID=A0ABP8GBM9_9SPHI
MKKYLLKTTLLLIALPLISWGPEGHSTVASVAENHLSPKAAAAVGKLLGGRHMYEVSSWADAIKPYYPKTAPMHFLNLPDKLTYAQFVNSTKSVKEANIYSAILNCIRELSANTTSPDRRVADLKFLIHLVGDAHQPMHVSRAKDKGGNSILVTFFTSKTNLHSVWDGKLIQHDEGNFGKLAKKIDQNVNSAQIAKWQNDDVLTWLWESYQISSRLYKEASANPHFGADYYNTHISIAENRLEAGGIRLAGILNRIYQ